MQYGGTCSVLLVLFCSDEGCEGKVWTLHKLLGETVVPRLKMDSTQLSLPPSRRPGLHPRDLGSHCAGEAKVEVSLATYRTPSLLASWSLSLFLSLFLLVDRRLGQAVPTSLSCLFLFFPPCLVTTSKFGTIGVEHLL